MKLLFTTLSNINANGGDTIQQAEELKMYAKENDCYFFSKYKFWSSVIIEQIPLNVKLIFPTKENNIDNYFLCNDNYVKQITLLDKELNFDYIFVRGSELLAKFCEENKELFKKKVICYLTDLNHVSADKEYQIFKNAKLIKCQSQRYIDIIAKKYGIDKSKFFVQPPIIDYVKTYKKEKKYDIIYTGKVQKHWGVREYLEYLERNPDVNGAIVYPVIKNILSDYDKIRVRELLQSLKNVTEFVNQTKTKSNSLLALAKCSYCIRDEEIDNDNSHEISTKLLESLALGVPCIVRKNKLHLDLLGNDYDFFVDDYDDLDDVVNRVTNQTKDYDFEKIVKNFYNDEIYKNVKNVLNNNLD